MAYELPDLPYAYDALEPHIDEATMRVHHDKHHATYVSRANEALQGTEWAEEPAQKILVKLDSLPDNIRTVVRNNAGGHYNHSLFWNFMSPNGGGAPSGALAQAIDSTFGSFDELKAAIRARGIGQFGSGWSWLVLDGAGRLAVVGTPNQDNPVSQGMTPLLGVDVWEHAYYLKYKNLRPDYIEAWFNVVNWDYVAQRFEMYA
jgi:superoxide dismutase, Fe-Mn family